jgi:hypothetical protein
VLAQSKGGFFGWPIKLVYLDKTYKLVGKGADTFMIYEDDQRVGSVVHPSIISPRKWLIDLPKDWPPLVAGFVFYVTYMISMWKEMRV